MPSVGWQVGVRPSASITAACMELGTMGNLSLFGCHGYLADGIRLV